MPISTRPALAAVVCLAGVAAASDRDLPRYALEEGQKITYVSQKTSEVGAYTRENDGSWTFWVLGANDDGSWQMIVRARNKLVTMKEGQEPRELWDKAWYGRFDLHPDGRYVYHPSLGFSLSPRTVFVPLPRTASEKTSAWSSDDPKFLTRYEMKAGAVHDDVYTFDLNGTRLTDEIYLVDRSATVTFDAGRGLVTKIVSSSDQKWGSGSKAQGSVTLDTVEVADRREMDELAREIDLYMEITTRYDQLTEEARRSLDTLDSVLAEAKRYLEEGREQLTLPELRVQLDEMIEIHGPRTNYHRDRAERKLALLGEPAPDWTLDDLDGNPVALADLRGNVVVLDFWYRGCTWCVRCMPQIKRVVAALEGEPFRFFGLTTDKDLDDSRFVIEKMELNYPSLQAGTTPQDYRVRAYPTMVIIDKQGIVRGVHVGFDAKLEEKLLAEVRALLAE